MNTARGTLIVTALLLSLPAPAWAQDPSQPVPQMPGTSGAMAHEGGMMRMVGPNGMMDPGGAMGAGGMLDRMMPMMGAPRHVDGWLAFLRTELKITDAQAGVWGDFADAIHANAARMGDSHASMAHQDPASLDLPQRLMAQEQMVAGRLMAMRRMREAIEPLYAVLSGAQKKTADDLLGSRGTM